jgi:hypothetical protein
VGNFGDHQWGDHTAAIGEDSVAALTVDRTLQLEDRRA